MSSEPIVPDCPRCGYDQSGEVGRWTEACPLRGRCVECGLDLDWGSLLTPGRAFVPGFVEHESGFWRTLIAAWRTAWWALVPTRLWRRVSLEAPIRPRRWLAWAAMLFLFSRLVLAVVVTSLECLPGPFHPASGPLRTGTEVAAEFVNAFAAPLLHVRAWQEAMGLAPAGTPNVVFAPPGFSGQRLPKGMRWAMIRNPVPLQVSFEPGQGLTRMLTVVFGGVAYSVAPLTLLCLPFTRRIARVRKLHVARAAVYSLSLLIIPELVRVLGAIDRTAHYGATAPSPFNSRSPPLLHRVLEARVFQWDFLVVGIALWLFWYWKNAVKSWRMAENERPVVFSLAAITGTIIAVVMIYQFTERWTSSLF